MADSVYHESGHTTIPEYLFIRDLPGRAGGDDGMNMNEKNKIDNCRTEPKLKLINMDSVEVEQVEWLLYPFIPYGKVTIIREFDTLKCKKVPQSLEIGLFFCQIFIFII